MKEKLMQQEELLPSEGTAASLEKQINLLPSTLTPLLIIVVSRHPGMMKIG